MDRLRSPCLLALLLLFVTFFVVQARTLNTFEPDYDEGVYLAEAHLVAAGHGLYSEVHSASPPLFIWGIAAIFRAAGGPAVLAVRLVILLTGALGLAATARIGYRLAQPGGQETAALYAALLLLWLPLWRYVGRVGMADIPSLSLSLLAIALALEGWRGGRRWYALGGVAAGLALGIKLLAAYT
ncbi:MAG: glycosyltransferase family 39 protein, partial [Ardenticatenales bacterium]|nr:glycosyltransferase family 39 protein [Ardenticatenales bacterium]